MPGIRHARAAQDAVRALFALIAGAVDRFRSLPFAKKARPFVLALAVPTAFLLLEVPYNANLLSMDPYYAGLNLVLLAILFGICYFVGQRSRAAVAAFLLACLAAGTANHFVILFKGQPVVPADLFALSTAASVGSGYSFELDASLLASIALFLGYCAVLFLMPKQRLSFRRGLTNATCALVLVGGFGWSLAAVDIEKAFDCTVDVWGVKESYAGQGSALCFLKRVQDLSPAEPDGYATAAIEDMLDSYADATAIPEAHAGELVEQPTVIAIMNETFSDLSRYPGLADTEARPARFHELAAEALEAGEAYASAMGGGTCNSEFEFLTGSSMAHLGGGVYPYVLYDLDKAESLVSYFSSMGYATHALHPAEGTNWRRDRIYAQLGFDRFSDIASFDGADTLRGLVTDRATYDYVLNLLAENEQPQFIFDVTMQNHGGYDVGGLSEEMSVSVPLSDGTTSPELNEYASVIRQADQDLAYLTEQLNALERPVVLCFFGDHQPGFSDWLFEATHEGVSADDLGLDAVQSRYAVPYLIWENDAARAIKQQHGNPAEHEADALAAGPVEQRSSLNYLGAKLVDSAGLPTTNYQRFLLSTSESIPAVNLNGYLSADGTWHWLDEEADAENLLDAYAWIQYDNLFG